MKRIEIAGFRSENHRPRRWGMEWCLGGDRANGEAKKRRGNEEGAIKGTHAFETRTSIARVCSTILEISLSF